MKNYLKFIKSNHAADKGFTLIEILVAAAIMSIVVTLAGTAFVALLQQNQKAKAESDRRTNLNRALDYIANDIRMAKTIESTTGLTLPSGATGVLKLTIPNPDPAVSTPYHVIYYISNSLTGWESPRSIMRFQASNDTTTTVPDPTTDNLLVDGIEAPSSFSCPSGTQSGGNGFYACISSTAPSANKSAEVFLYGKIKSNNISSDTTPPYLARTRVYTRANELN
ncbi:PulJ/GspJ family protein [Sphaerospermopsis torques-reginae]|uniref:Prepilin-type N-terminal cleavage/methylation domain-containing protein n=1 Tax=Sphaerospermopsis torques-reginae ITEP-024 TaxID=984208 RepID=A0ABX8WTX2_9CYAN|nr:prepilin-type N-terminal cleavage/methylation domain-containing protein [Sphaerospermopsis torques-reginae]QYX29829.1 prepilin-type N-terminal cleavage/methylation domain-containing protein [Sphaerospermopsis torques-reginae ITEP-024]